MYKEKSFAGMLVMPVVILVILAIVMVVRIDKAYATATATAVEEIKAEAIAEVQDDEIQKLKEVPEASCVTNAPASYVPSENARMANAMGPDFIGFLTLGSTVAEPVAETVDPSITVSQIYKDGSWETVKKGGTVASETLSFGRIFYGHNMKDGTLFGKLNSYLDNVSNENVLNELGLTGSFETLHGIENFRVVAIASRKVGDYDLYQIQNMDDFHSYFDSSVVYGSLENVNSENLITLQTCGHKGSNKKTYIFCEVM